MARKGPLFDFAPTLNQFLRAHLFGDIFIRDVLNHQDREIATIAALATIQGADAQLKAHYGIALNTGLTQIQLQEITQIITSKVNEDTGNYAKRILKQ
ncbi:carboxymuconolactone decarboxylase family protein [Commensalibacter papalotli (ex Botero et al. 2024)]|uniref:carboxymuconolactone decarboxylase family protein n=1 Tax=Commensalibacter papalotli (ex Botero et al. 2024) TaxID=2972766 RepID=UPI00249009C3|nr:carboxymuconolactone decarboxylase family protein [Commensalibacter papalotli (ex Botero et al. 2024)]